MNSKIQILKGKEHQVQHDMYDISDKYISGIIDMVITFLSLSQKSEKRAYYKDQF